MLTQMDFWPKNLFLSRLNQVRWRIWTCVETDFHRVNSCGCIAEEDHLQCLQEGMQAYDWGFGVEEAFGFIASTCTGS